MLVSLQDLVYIKVLLVVVFFSDSGSVGGGCLFRRLAFQTSATHAGNMHLKLPNPPSTFAGIGTERLPEKGEEQDTGRAACRACMPTENCGQPFGHFSAILLPFIVLKPWIIIILSQ